MDYRVKFYERGDDGRRRLLRSVSVEAPGVPDLRTPLRWGAGVLSNSTPDYLSRVIEVRVELVESPAKVAT